MAVVALAGMGLRRMTAQPPARRASARCALLVHAASLLHGRGHLWADLLPDPGDRAGLRGAPARRRRRRSRTTPRPAPSNRGTILAISLLIGLTARRRRRDRRDVPQPGAGRHPAAVRLPRLGDQLRRRPRRLVRRARRPRVARAGGPAGRAARCAPGAPRAPHSSSGALARPDHGLRDDSAGWSASAPSPLAIVAAGTGPPPARRPSSPTGWAAAPTAAAAAGLAACSLSSSIDIARDLGNRSTDPVLALPQHVRPTSSRCASASSTATAAGSGRRAPTSPSCPSTARSPAPLAGPEVPRRVERISVVDNADRGAPGRAARRHRREPLPRRHVEHDRAAGSCSSPHRRRPTRPSSSSSTPRTRSSPPTSDIPAGRPATSSRSTRAPRPRCARVLDQLTDDGDSAARRSPGRCRPTCAARSSPTRLELAEHGGRRAPVRRPLARFLRDQARLLRAVQPRRWSCSSRAAGIPARMAFGFLPGSIDGDDRVVRVSRRPRVARAVLPAAGLGALRAHPGRPAAAPPRSTASCPPARRRPRAPARPPRCPRRRPAPSTAPTRDVTDA